MDNELLGMFYSIEEHLLKDELPSIYLESASGLSAFARFPFTMLLRLKQTPQSKKFHPEGNAWNHTMLVVDEAAQRWEQSADARAFMWAALLHDIGKPDTTKTRNGRITAYDHDRLGAKLAREFLSACGCEEGLIQNVVSLVKWHMQILYFEKSLPFFKLSALREDASVEDVALLSLCDRLGRTGAIPHDEQRNVQTFLHTIRGDTPSRRF